MEPDLSRTLAGPPSLKANIHTDWRLRPGDYPHEYQRRSQIAGFAHQPLALHLPSIRLVEILAPGRNGTIRCYIRHTTFNVHPPEGSTARSTVPEYTCLSYQWRMGSGDSTRQIQVNGRSYHVQENLYDFLRVASTWSAGSDAASTPKLDISRCIRSLWIDALCIDQEDMAERNHQVQQMGWIYSNARHVISWLGCRPDIASLLRFARTHPCDEYPQSSQEVTAKQEVPMIQLQSHTYWTRAWITQEVILARDLHLLAQDETVDFATLQRLGAITEQKTVSGPHGQFWWPISDARKHKEKLTLMENIWRFQNKQCSEIRDLAYSLLSISENGSSLHVDYQCSLSQLAVEIISLVDGSICLCRLGIVFEALQLTKSKVVDGDLLCVAMEGTFVSYLKCCPSCGVSMELCSAAPHIPVNN